MIRKNQVTISTLKTQQKITCDVQYSSAGWTLLKSRIIATTHLRIFVALGLQIFCGLPQHRIFATSAIQIF